MFANNISPSIKTVGFITLILCMVYTLSGCLENESPVAVAGVDQTISSEFNASIYIDGQASYDPNGDSIRFHWTLERIPEGSEIKLTDFNAMEISVTLDVPGEYRFGLVVTDGNSSSNKDIVVVRYFPNGVISSGTFTDMVISHPIADGQSCDECHGNLEAEFHIALTGPGYCVACHYPDNWVPVIMVDHEFVSSDCKFCHVISDDHIDTDEDCNACHETFHWEIDRDTNGEHIGPDGVVTFNHDGIGDNCIDCHSINNIATAKPSYHITTSDRCAECHNVASWVASIMTDHSEVFGGCHECHNGIVAMGMSAAHIATTNSCSNCHATSFWFPPITVDHGEVLGVCENCHSGVVARGKSITHIMSSNICDACHSTANWPPVIVDHQEVIGDCETCHMPPESHKLVGVASSCDSCHMVEDSLGLQLNWMNSSQPLP